MYCCYFYKLHPSDLRPGSPYSIWSDMKYLIRFMWFQRASSDSCQRMRSSPRCAWMILESRSRNRLHYRRRRRSADAEVSGSRAHYRFEAFGQAFHLNLTADSGFIAPVLHGASPGERKRKRGDAADLQPLFLQRHVNDHSEHHAVFSLCTD